LIHNRNFDKGLKLVTLALLGLTPLKCLSLGRADS
jgi:hypothetical protein